MVDFRAWQDAQIEEKKWWGNFVNTFNEEEKQFFYAEKMCIYFSGAKSIDLFQQSFLDIGSNAISMLLKGFNAKRAVVVDPIELPAWALERYKTAKIEYIQKKGEDIDFLENTFDECWIYNCLQHVQDPEQIIKKAIKASKCLRIFEWLGTYERPDDKEGNELNKKLHPIVLTEKDLNTWIGQKGEVETVNLPLVKGEAYYGVFIK